MSEVLSIMNMIIMEVLFHHVKKKNMEVRISYKKKHL